MPRPVQQLCITLRSRQLSQNLVEFGLSVAAVAFVAMLGFGALGQAQAAYWGAPKPALSQPPPASGNFLHRTSIVITTCDRTSLVVGDHVNCTIVITDTDTIHPSPPVGSAGVLVDDGASLSGCSSLSPLGGSPPASKCDFSWQPAQSDIGPRTLTPTYTPTDGIHGAPSSASPYPILVQPRVDVKVNPSADCAVPWTNTPAHVEIGHPIICTVSVTDHTTHAAMSNAQVTWHADPIPGPIGAPLFTCFSNNSAAALNGCPTPASTYPCVTDATGTCKIVFRYFPTSDADTISIPGKTVTVTATAFPTDQSSDNLATASVTIGRAQSDHGAGFSVSCAWITGGSVTSDPPVGWPVPNYSTRVVSSLSTLHVHSGGGPVATATVTCTVVVFDPSASASLDIPSPCVYSGPLSPDPCNVDYEDSYVPFGSASLHDSVGGAYACPVAGLTWQPHPSNLPPLLQGESEFATSCQMTLTLSGNVGTSTTMWATYDGESATWKQHFAATSPTFTISFDP